MLWPTAISAEMPDAEEPVLSLAERIVAAHETLSPREQRVAEVIRDRAGDIGLYNSAELARLSGVSKATVSRLFRRLGFAGSREVRDLLRAERGAGVPVAVGEPTDGPGRLSPMDGQLRSDQQNIARLYSILHPETLGAVVDCIARANRVLVLGFRSAVPVALQLRQQLAQVREAVAIAPQAGQSISEELAGCTSGDVVILMGFRRRPARFASIVAAIGESAATCVLITDPTGQRYADGADWVIECPIDSPSPFDSYAAAMSLVSLLAGSVLAARGPAARERVAAITSSYARLGELESL